MGGSRVTILVSSPENPGRARPGCLALPTRRNISRRVCSGSSVEERGSMDNFYRMAAAGWEAWAKALGDGVDTWSGVSFATPDFGIAPPPTDSFAAPPPTDSFAAPPPTDPFAAPPPTDPWVWTPPDWQEPPLATTPDTRPPPVALETTLPVDPAPNFGIAPPGDPFAAPPPTAPERRPTARPAPAPAVEFGRTPPPASLLRMPRGEDQPQRRVEVRSQPQRMSPKQMRVYLYYGGRPMLYDDDDFSTPTRRSPWQTGRQRTRTPRSRQSWRWNAWGQSARQPSTRRAHRGARWFDWRG